MRSTVAKIKPVQRKYDVALFPLTVVSVGHLVVDMYSGGFPVLFPTLQLKYQLTYAQIGLLVLLAQFSSSVLQPLFGLWSDKLNARFVMQAGLGLAALGLAVIVFAPSYLLVLMGTIIMGLGVAAYHPEASKLALFAGGQRKATAMSVFALSGNVGLSLGPGLMAFGLALWHGKSAGELFGALLFVPIALATLLTVHVGRERIYRVVPAHAHASKIAAGEQTRRDASGRLHHPIRSLLRSQLRLKNWPVHYRWMLMLLVYIFIRSSAHTGMQTLIPLYYQGELGATDGFSSLVLTAFLAGGVVGTLLGGLLADAVGARTIALASFLVSAPLIAMVPYVGGGVVAVAVMFFAGVVLIASFSLTTVMGQRFMPANVGLASGLTLGFSVGTGGMGAALLGVVADAWGLESAWIVVALLLTVGLVFAWALPKDEAIEAHVDRRS